MHCAEPYYPVAEYERRKFEKLASNFSNMIDHLHTLTLKKFWNLCSPEETNELNTWEKKLAIPMQSTYSENLQKQDYSIILPKSALPNKLKLQMENAMRNKTFINIDDIVINHYKFVFNAVKVLAIEEKITNILYI